MFGSLVCCLSVTLIGSLFFRECYGTKLFEELNDEEKALLAAAEKKQWAEMLKLVKEGVNVDITDVFGSSIINLAVAYSNAEVVEELITVGATHIVNKQIAKGDKGNKGQLIKTVATHLVNSNYNSNRYPIYLAVNTLDKAIFDVLLKHGADPKKVKTLLNDVASICRKARASESHKERSHKEMARILIDTYKFDVNLRDSSQETPFHKAAYYDCDQEFMEILTSRGAEVNARDKDGQTPLHKAADRGCAEAVNALIKLHADLEIKDNQGRTALNLAEKQKLSKNKVGQLSRLSLNSGQEKVAKLLRDAVASQSQIMLSNRKVTKL